MKENQKYRHADCPAHANLRPQGPTPLLDRLDVLKRNVLNTLMPSLDYPQIEPLGGHSDQTASQLSPFVKRTSIFLPGLIFSTCSAGVPRSLRAPFSGAV